MTLVTSIVGVGLLVVGTIAMHQHIDHTSRAALEYESGTPRRRKVHEAQARVALILGVLAFAGATGTMLLVLGRAVLA